METTKVCAPLEGTGGLCNLKVELPESFWGSLASEDSVSIDLELLTGTGTALKYIGVVSTHAKAQFADEEALDTVYMALPARDLLPGDEVEIEVRSRFSVAIKTAEVRLLAGDGVEFVGYELSKLDNEFVFFGTVDQEAKLVSAAIARKAATPLNRESGPTDELLFTVAVRVADNVAAGTVGLLTIHK